MKEFPNFLQFQDELELLFFYNNKIQGEIPTWFWNNTNENIREVQLGNYFLTGFEQHPDVIPWRSLLILDLSFNRLQGSLPIPPLSTIVYEATGNSLSGEIPPSIICHNSSLKFLDLSNNNLGGTIPQCLPSFSDSLLVVNPSHNNFHGTIPDMTGINLKMIDLSQNQLHGLVPRSLENCTMLEILLLGNNQMEGTFPSWLGALPKLQVLILRSNRFHGAINVSQAKLKFAKLRIIDLSNNGFSGNLPSEYFENWNAMTMVKREKLTYMQASQGVPIGIVNSRSTALTLYTRPYVYSVTMDNKGTHTVYAKIQTAFIAIDLSNNKFGGEIPESLGRLNGLQMLNLSNNSLTGVIPSSLANLTELESLDLSQNLLSGEIPQQLSQLTFLEFLNVSHYCLFFVKKIKKTDQARPIA
ncbi:receptor like protein 27-like [Camellia sinensis]|uniref:receptor like protein 27-like n=1 Tax=Camellia sinensis TaxID=4442 RepID=UPI001036A2D0|nr:receptor like protein 27-like [Camellia sinensis]